MMDKKLQNAGAPPVLDYTTTVGICTGASAHLRKVDRGSVLGLHQMLPTMS
jgi:hypothetical protein